MSVLDQRVSILSSSSTASRRPSTDEDNEIRINKPNIYHEDRIDLKN
jgi:hypothetical protein